VSKRTDAIDATEICRQLSLAVQAIGPMPREWYPPELIAGPQADRPRFPPCVLEYDSKCHDQEIAYYDDELDAKGLEAALQGDPLLEDSLRITFRAIVERKDDRRRALLEQDVYSTNLELWRRAWWAALAFQHALKVYQGVLAPPAPPEPPAGQEGA